MESGYRRMGEANRGWTGTVVQGQRRRRRAIASTYALLAVLLAGCSTGDGAAPTAAESSATEHAGSPSSTPEASEAPSEPSDPVRVTEDMTPPGAQLHFGQKAVVPIRDRNNLTGEYTEGVLGIVVEQVQQVPGQKIVGHFDEHSRQVLDNNYGYYARVIITNESGNDMSNALRAPRTELRTAGGGGADISFLGGQIAECPEVGGAPESFDHKGATWVTCEVRASSASRPLTEVHYLEVPYGREPGGPYAVSPPEFDQYYSLGAIVWS